jgi:NAD(P)-dependent dehydrogenase (short-subunit alcohol dehydrogenase family)
MNMRSVLDGFLELTVVASFSRLGYRLRRWLFGWQAPPDGELRGRTALITGPTSGLGKATAFALAGLGARVVLAGRSRERLEAVRKELVAAHGEDRFPILVVDMASLHSVREATRRILDTEARLDVLIDNAGTIGPERRESPDGLEMTFATMVAGPFLLLAGLRPLLERTGGGRVIAVTSGGQYTQPLALDDLGYERTPFDGPRAYARAKRAQVGLVREWARRLGRAGSDVTVNAMHPGWADTPGLAATLPGFHRVMGPLLRAPEEGIDTIVWLATDRAATGAGAAGGRLYLDRRARPFDRAPQTRTKAVDRRRLWDLVVAMTGGPDPLPESGDRPGNPSARGLRTTG